MTEWTWPEERRHDRCVREVARRFGVRLVEVPREDPRAKGASPEAGLEARRRTVFHVPFATGEHPEVVLHEVLHLALAPPPRITGCSRQEAIAFTPEEMLLLPFEQRVARTMSRTLEALVRDWQGATTTWMFDAPGRPLSEVSDVHTSTTWTRALVLARELGILDSRGRPTWKRPRWSRAIGREMRRAMKHVREHAERRRS